MARKKDRIDTSGRGGLSENNPFAGLNLGNLPDKPAEQAPQAVPSKRGAEKKSGGGERIELRRLKAGKGGKVVTEIRGLRPKGGPLKDLVRDLKQKCGTGGTVKGDAVEIQGDYRDQLSEILSEMGYRVVLAGG